MSRINVSREPSNTVDSMVENRESKNLIWSAVKDPSIWFCMLVIICPVAVNSYILRVSDQSAFDYFTQPIFLFFVVNLCIVLYLSHSSLSSKLTSNEIRIANWFLVNGIILNNTDMLAGVLQKAGVLSAHYNITEPRFLLPITNAVGAPTLMTAILEIFVQAPMCSLVYYSYHRNKSWKAIPQVVVSLLHFIGCYFFYFSEMFNLLPNIHPSGFHREEMFSLHYCFYLYFGLFFMVALWVIVPLHLAYVGTKELVAICNEKQNEKIKMM